VVDLVSVEGITILAFEEDEGLVTVVIVGSYYYYILF
jgi:hypothetical protein